MDDGHVGGGGGGERKGFGGVSRVVRCSRGRGRNLPIPKFPFFFFFLLFGIQFGPWINIKIFVVRFLNC